jgi:hypothetical protein
MATVQNRIKCVLFRSNHPHSRLVANWLYDNITHGRELWVTKDTAPVDPRKMSCTEQRDLLIKSGLVTQAGLDNLSWLMIPTDKLRKYFNITIDLTHQDNKNHIVDLDNTVKSML